MDSLFNFLSFLVFVVRFEKYSSVLIICMDRVFSFLSLFVNIKLSKTYSNFPRILRRTTFNSPTEFAELQDQFVKSRRDVSAPAIQLFP